jgi:CheY-like chemotaxis protein
VLLELWGYDVTVAHDGRAALSAISELRPDVALIDLSMPQLDGLEVARRVRAGIDPHAVRLIAMTGMADQSDYLLTGAAGFDLHLVKPIDPQVLRALLPAPGQEPEQSAGLAASADGRRPAV